LKNSLQILAELAPERSIVVAREMTKKFEEFVEGTPQHLKEKWSKNPPKGEITLVI
jgi:16S rRNA (cytidine1402-2'-O)-methyltransferase